MTVRDLSESVLAALAAVQRLIDRLEDRGVIVGGAAANLLGSPRFTADVDAMVMASFDEIPDLLNAAKLEGLTPRIDDVAAFARRSRVLLLRHEPSDTNIDISLGVLPFEAEMIEGSTLHAAGELKLRLPAPEDLIVMKAVAHRSKDYADIETVIARHPDLDWRRIEFWVRQFADALEMPELWIDLARLRPPSTHP